MNKRSFNNFKKTISILTISVLIFSTFLTFSSFHITQKSKAANEDIKWNLTINVEDENNLKDYVLLGEAQDANDGPPADSYDTPKPPAPMPSYIRAWFKTNLDPPYNLLWKEYKKYPSEYNIWNLSIIYSSSNISSTNIKISWDKTQIKNIEYNSALIYQGDSVIVDMKNVDTYSFNASSDIIYNFQISLKDKTPENNTNNLSIGFVILIIISVAFYFSRKKH